MTGWQSIGMNFRIWSSLMTSDYTGYGIIKDYNPETECIECFWTSLNEDDVYPKHFLEELMQIVDDIETGKVEPVPFTREMFDRIDDLIGGDLVDALNLEEELEDGDV